MMVQILGEVGYWVVMMVGGDGVIYAAMLI